MKPEEREELLSAYALGTLSEPDTAVVRDLVRSDGDAAEELAGYHEIVDMIALSAPLRHADPALRSRVIAAARRERSGARHLLHPRRWLPWAAASAAALLLFAWGWGLQQDLNALRTDNAILSAVVEGEAKRLESLVQADGALSTQSLQLQVQAATSEFQMALAVATAPDVRQSALESTAAGHGARGQFLWSTETGAGWLTATGLPQLGLDRVYEVWLLDDEQVVSGGTFIATADGGVESLVAPGVIIRPTRIVIGVSPFGGADELTLPAVLDGSMLR
ncbi:MAG TPA: anti-sigma factor [Dehalococcoidia bacterium]|nr:anti-sigma factor [Dehalococcoidia bacterium]